MNKRELLIGTLALFCAWPLFTVLSFAQSNSTEPSPTQSPAAASSPAPAVSSTPSPGGGSPEATRKGSPRVVPPEKAQPLKIPLFAKPPVIDGKLDDEVW